jgi:hypothetical protein
MKKPGNKQESERLRKRETEGRPKREKTRKKSKKSWRTENKRKWTGRNPRTDPGEIERKLSEDSKPRRIGERVGEDEGKTTEILGRCRKANCGYDPHIGAWVSVKFHH